SSTSWFTWRRRSGFDLRVWTPCWVRVDRRMKIGMTGGAYSARCLVEEEERPEHDLRQEQRDALTVVHLGVQERAEDERGERDDDHERGERAERVTVVGRAELAAALERRAEASPLHHRDGHGETHQREPGEPGQDEERTQGRERQVDQHRDAGGDPVDGTAEHEVA